MDGDVWLITGCSSGFGREIAAAALTRGKRVVATARNPDALAVLGNAPPERMLRMRLDVTARDQIDAAVSAAEASFGGIDVLVNNAGIGHFGAIEESASDDTRRMFEINFWGLSEMTCRVLPSMRRRRRGCIINMSSVGGLRGSAGVGHYNASKFAVEGFSEALAQEVGPLGISVIIVEPSGFRTDFAGRSATEISAAIPDYEPTAGARRTAIRRGSGRQPGNPTRAATAIIDAAEMPHPPLHLPLGRAALRAGRDKVEALTRDLEAAAAVAEWADFPLDETAPVPA